MAGLLGILVILVVIKLIVMLVKSLGKGVKQSSRKKEIIDDLSDNYNQSEKS
jgi:hypothetical protein